MNLIIFPVKMQLLKIKKNAVLHVHQQLSYRLHIFLNRQIRNVKKGYARGFVIMWESSSLGQILV